MSVLQPPARCHYCRTTDELLDGDGPKVVCRVCVSLFGGMVTLPGMIGPGMLDDLLTVHGEVVQLERLSTGDLRWVWTPSWPGVDRKTRHE